MKILISGGLGFAGSSLTEYLLEKGYEVTVIDKMMFDNKQLKKFQNNNFKFFKLDILNKKKLENFFINKNFDVVFILQLSLETQLVRLTKATKKLILMHL